VTFGQIQSLDEVMREVGAEIADIVDMAHDSIRATLFGGPEQEDVVWSGTISVAGTVRPDAVAVVG
jgi:hypothetical protein